MTARPEDLLDSQTVDALGLAGGTFSLTFQPQVCVSSRRPVAAEALIRARDAEGLLVSNDRWIPLVEQIGAMHRIDLWVSQVAVEAAALIQKFHKNFNVSMNLSPDRATAKYALELLERLDHWSVDPTTMTVEVTETVYVRDLEQLAQVASVLRDNEVGLAIDDFGTGWAPMMLLQTLPVSELKLDREFVAGLSSHNIRSEAVARAVVTMGRDLKMRLVAEGVETVEQANIASGLGFQRLQGWMYGRPMPLIELLHLLHNDACDGTNVVTMPGAADASAPLPVVDLRMPQATSGADTRIG